MQKSITLPKWAVPYAEQILTPVRPMPVILPDEEYSAYVSPEEIEEALSLIDGEVQP